MIVSLIFLFTGLLIGFMSGSLFWSGYILLKIKEGKVEDYYYLKK